MIDFNNLKVCPICDCFLSVADTFKYHNHVVDCDFRISKDYFCSFYPFKGKTILITFAPEHNRISIFDYLQKGNIDICLEDQNIDDFINFIRNKHYYVCLAFQ